MSEPEIELHTKVDTPDSQGLSAVRELIVHQSVLDAMAEHVSTDTTVEHGGVMLGGVDAKTGAVTITGSIAAIGAVSSVASLTFTHETWDQISEVQERSFPGTKMVGWYHSHPHFGIFLSDHDLFIHRNFFKELWQVAYVIDPLLRQEGFFVWENGDVARLQRWQVVSDGGTPQGHLGVQEPARGMVPPPPPPPAKKRSVRIISSIVAIALLAFLAGSGVGLMVGGSKSERAAPTQKPIALPRVANVAQLVADGKVQLGIAATQIASSGSQVWFCTEQPRCVGEPPDKKSLDVPEKAEAIKAIAVSSGDDADVDDVAWVIAPNNDESGKSFVYRGDTKIDLDYSPDPQLIVVSADGNVAWAKTGSKTITKLEIPGNSKNLRKPSVVNFDTSGLSPSLEISQLAAWGTTLVVLGKDGNMYVEESGILSEDVKSVVEIAAYREHLWYLTADSTRRKVHHRTLNDKEATHWKMQVGKNAHIAAAPGYVWVTENLDGWLVRLSADGGTLVTDHRGPTDNEALAATADSLWALTKQVGANGNSLAMRYQIGRPPTFEGASPPASTSTSTRVPTATSRETRVGKPGGR
ncbi:MAG: hypothetical protein EXQ69_03245 [Acidimicrobiia bacterium]|nr:hypothetical protein [Acidimicrobiia bacterium]